MNLTSDLCFVADYTENCQWEGPYTGYTIGSTTSRTLYGIEDIDSCKELCEEEDTYNCMSFDYRISTKYCYLKKANLYTNQISINTDYDYYERNCRGECPMCSHSVILASILIPLNSIQSMK